LVSNFGKGLTGAFGESFDVRSFAAAFGESFNLRSFGTAFGSAFNLGEAQNSFVFGFMQSARVSIDQIRGTRKPSRDGRRSRFPSVRPVAASWATALVLGVLIATAEQFGLFSWLSDRGFVSMLPEAGTSSSNKAPPNVIESAPPKVAETPPPADVAETPPPAIAKAPPDVVETPPPAIAKAPPQEPRHPHSRPEVADAGDTVQGLYDALLSSMKKGRNVGQSGRLTQLEPVIRKSFDIPTMARLSVGPSWALLSEAKRQQVTDSFGRYISAIYADRFDSNRRQKLQVTGAQRSADGIIVRSQIVKANGEPVRIDYKMHRNGDSWLISDIYLDGAISEVASRRSEFAAILRTDGIDGLIAALNRKADMLTGTIVKSF
jgi:phospholipid transport system substrate-binding protein